MGLEDLAMMRAVHGSTVLYPCDANQTARLVAAMAGLEGIRYLRTSRGESPVIYGPDEEFPVGGSKVLRSSGQDRLTLVAAGVTVPEALAAADTLADEGVAVRVVDLYSVKPVDVETLRTAAEETGCLMTVEDHHPEGGLGDAVAEAFGDGRPVPWLVRLAVRNMPGSAAPRSSCTPPGSTPRRSPRPAGCWWGRRSCRERRRLAHRRPAQPAVEIHRPDKVLFPGGDGAREYTRATSSTTTGRSPGTCCRT